MWSIGGMIMTRKLNYTRKTPPQCFFVKLVVDILQTSGSVAPQYIIVSVNLCCWGAHLSIIFVNHSHLWNIWACRNKFECQDVAVIPILKASKDCSPLLAIAQWVLPSPTVNSSKNCWLRLVCILASWDFLLNLRWLSSILVVTDQGGLLKQAACSWIF
jgi:hypothetical protein